MYVDSHLHFDVFIEGGEVEAVLERAARTRVTRMVAIGGSEEANARALALAAGHPAVIRAAVGFDRDQIMRAPSAAALAESLRRPEVVAVGETGLDYHYEPDTAAAQRELFAAMLECAARCAKPVVVHSREADEDTLSLLRDYLAKTSLASRPGVLHCFTGTQEFARRLLDLGFYISFSGIVTFRNAEDLRGVARYVPADRLLIETDSPYLAPVPLRGKRNEPANVVHVADALARIRHDSPAKIADTTRSNAEALFDWRNDFP